MQKGIIIDNFAGGGGVSKGFEEAGLVVDYAINHDADAIAMYKINHPNTIVFNENIWYVDPREVAKDRPVCLAWFSPDCTHHSRARGGKPRKKNIRALAWVTLRWAATVKPEVIILENVVEFQEWGPLTIEGKPDPKQKCRTFKSFVNALKRHGYKVEYRELVACDYGAPTSRKRFFLIARRDGKPIVWPKPTHGDPDRIEVRCGLLKPWRTAAECIDFSRKCPGIFSRKKPLADNTQRRIAKGLDKFVLKNSKPFIVQVNHSGDNFRGQDIHEPLQTVTSKHGYGIVAPSLIQYHTETIHSGARGQSVEEPLKTLDTSNRYGLATAFISKYYGGFYDGAGSGTDEPMHTITSKDHNALITSHLVRFNNNCDGRSMNEPIPTIVAGQGHWGEARTFLTTYYGNEGDIGQSTDEPLRTITSKDRFGIVSITIVKIINGRFGYWPEVRELLNK